PNAVAVKPRQRSRIGVIMPKLDPSLNTTMGAAELLRSTMMQYLGGPALEVLMITSMLPQQIQLEAVDKGCDFLLASTLGDKKSAGIMDSVLGKAAPLMSLTPVGNIGAAAGTIAGGKKPASSPSMNAGDIAKSLKAKDEVMLD